jgi:hypothetical protein
MRTLALFNDGSPEAGNAAEFALSIAQKVKADILILNLCEIPEGKVQSSQAVCEHVAAGNEEETDDLVAHLCDSIAPGDFKPVITEVDASSYADKDICGLIIRKNIWMMIKGIESYVTHHILSQVDFQAVLNHVASPLLLVPDNYHKKDFENITYAVDMRYCRTAVVKFLSELAHRYGANLVIEHFSAKGLPHLSNDYARSLLATEITGKINYQNIFFNNIKERNLGDAVDVMVNDLHADLLGLVNHRFHFEELFGRSIGNVLPEHISVPVIVFPL